MRTLTSFACTTTPPAFDHPRAERQIDGNPLRTTWNHYTANGVDAGRWACEPGAWQIAFAEDKDEFFQVLSGRIRITDQAGTPREFGPSDACVIPGGFRGVFEVLEAVTKHYVIIERSAIGK